jgi:hypothetical protein
MPELCDSLLVLFEKKMRGMIVRRHDHFRREPYPLGEKGAAGRRVTAPPAGAFARTGQYD